MFWVKLISTVSLISALIPKNAFAETQDLVAAVTQIQPAVVAQASAAPVKAVAVDAKPVAPVVAKAPTYRTFITIQSYVMDNNGDAKNPISNVRLEVKFPGDKKFELPEGGQYWPIGNGQKQDINRTFELPYGAISADGFAFSIQMVRKGSKLLPCNFNVTQLSQYNRAYFCHTDVQWQVDQKISEERLDREGVQIRVFTDLNTPARELPKDALALR